MTCQNCGREGADDPATGYNADELCPECKASGFDVDNDGNLFDLPAERRPAQYCTRHNVLMVGGVCGMCEAEASNSDIGDDECPF